MAKKKEEKGVRELLDHMEKDPLFRHKVLLDFYTYKKETEKNDTAIEKDKKMKVSG